MTAPIFQPFDLEVWPGKTVRQLASRGECQQALFRLEMDMADITAQIARDEAEPGLHPPGWRTRAQNAMRWKKRVKTAIADFAKRYDPPSAPAATKRKLLLDVIKDELGADEFDRLVGIAKGRHPHAFGREVCDV